MGIHHLYVLWMVIISVHVSAGVELLQRHVGESVVIRCSGLPDQGGISPYGVRLKRCWLRQDLVVFMHEHSKPFVSNPLESTRINVSGDPSARQVNVTISDLRASDTDRYCCEFIVAATPDDRIIPGKVEFFIYVDNGGQCTCSSYSTLLYALFAAVAVMLLLLMLVIYWVRGRIQVKPQAQVPIYEEMVGVRPPKPKQGPRGLGTFHLEEADVSDYSNSLVVKPRAENHYESPTLARISQG